ncbi:MAG TPA: ABC transporter substrate-binding protein [Kaistia sp.]|nr:ABC transporter substrate-binding protein [Kaistia sp.]
MKRIAALASASIVAIAATVCGSAAFAAPLTFWNGFTGPDRPTIEALTKQWSDAHPDTPVQMDIEPWDSMLQKLQAAMASGSGPDVVAFNFAQLPRYAESGFIMDITDEVKAGGALDPSVWSDGLKQVLQYNGKYYAAPLNFATLMMYYNKDIFAKAGISEPPKTWDEWVAAIKKTTVTGSNSQYGLLIPDHETIPNWPILLWGNGGDVIKDGKPYLDDAKTIGALTLWGDLVLNDKITPTGLSGADADKLFQSGKAAMEITGPWMTNGFTAAKLNYDVAPIPTGPGGPVTLADSIVLVINKATKDPKAALDFVAMWNSKAAQLKIANDTGFPPLRTDLSGSPELTNEWAAKFSTVVPVSRFSLPGQVNFAQIDGDVFTPMIQAITFGKEKAAEAAQQANDQLSDLLNQ